ncbi:BCCT family transporter [Enterococcus avium]|uniref:BCCT family transporter n=1 Tax=Enterococcus avium TaxID=33945 RepID=UPI00288D7302|nr:BCCT family transporter [Enterococcus avium]MDT2499663.1 BCCT family transporter [Enterococcus avium]
MKKNIVFYVSLLITAIIVVIGLIAPGPFAQAMNSTKAFLVDTFGWFYLIAMFVFVVFSLLIAFSRFGKIKLGPDDSVPEYSNKSWFAMLFGAGMGIGLVFWGVAEPLNHFATFGGTEKAADIAMQKSFLHWGLSSMGGLFDYWNGAGLLPIQEKNTWIDQQYFLTDFRRGRYTRTDWKTN